jgi:hypothetical protein
MYIRWTENPYFESFGAGEVDESGQAWAGYSRIELANLNVETSGNVLRQIYSPAHIVNINDIENLPDFDYDPMKISNQSGFHTIRIEEGQE